MQMIYCPNCRKRTGFRRALGFGTFFMVVITLGLWLLVIPLCPARCMTCGLQRQEALWTNLFTWWQSRSTGQKVVAGLMLASLIVVVSALPPHSHEPAPIVEGPDYNKPRSTYSDNALRTSTDPTSPVAEGETGSAASHPTDHQLRLVPSFSGVGAIEDGRVYSVALIVAASDIPPNTQLLAQGKVSRFGYAGVQSRPFAVLEDEQQSGKMLLCAMKEDDGREALSLYHVGEPVRVSGDYMGNVSLADNPAMPVLSNCQMAGPQNDVVRPAESAN